MGDLVTIAGEVSGADYLSLIEFARAQGSLFSLVWREQLRFDPSAWAVADALRPALAVEQRADSWPGTRLDGSAGMAAVNLYAMTDESVRVLTESGSLYAWHAPRLPEDLAFYTPDGRPWFGSIAHESDAFLCLDVIDVSLLLLAVPGIRLHGSDER